MSQWTHVSGCFRLDGIPQAMRMPSIPKILGTPSNNAWLGEEDYRAAKDIPSGSEGSIQYKIIDAGRGMVWKTVAVWGDLRDFGAEDCHEIDQWFSRIVARWPLIREAHLVVSIEGGETYLLAAEDKDVRRTSLRSSPEKAAVAPTHGPEDGA